MTLASIVSGCTGLALNPPPVSLPTPTHAPDGGEGAWEQLAPGLERRLLAPKPGNPLAQMLALRIDPARYTFRVHYRPGQRLTLDSWRDALPGAAAIVNANFFDAAGNAVGLVVADGTAYGQSYVGRGGMFEVRAGAARVRSLIAHPYAGEPLDQAVQAFPNLVVDGQASYTNRGDHDVSRRTVIAQDSAGRILWLATPLVGLTLADLSAYLAGAGLDIVQAVNMDGGRSTMLYVGAGGAPVTVPSFDAVPAVLAIYPVPG